VSSYDLAGGDVRRNVLVRTCQRAISYTQTRRRAPNRFGSGGLSDSVRPPENPVQLLRSATGTQSSGYCPPEPVGSARGRAAGAWTGLLDSLRERPSARPSGPQACPHPRPAAGHAARAHSPWPPGTAATPSLSLQQSVFFEGVGLRTRVLVCPGTLPRAFAGPLRSGWASESWSDFLTPYRQLHRSCPVVREARTEALGSPGRSPSWPT
jgi:hypothetical protein